MRLVTSERVLFSVDHAEHEDFHSATSQAELCVDLSAISSRCVATRSARRIDRDELQTSRDDRRFACCACRLAEIGYGPPSGRPHGHGSGGRDRCGRFDAFTA